MAWLPCPSSSGPRPAWAQHWPAQCPESCFSGSLFYKLAMPGRRGSPPHWGHHLGCFPTAPACPAWEPPRPSPLLCRDMALQNALYTGNLARLLELFPPHSTADLLLESRAAEPRWSSHQRGEDQGGLGWAAHIGHRGTKSLRKRSSLWQFPPHPKACLNLGPGVKSCGAQNSSC